MAVPETLKAKVCLVGETAVGKTSLVRRFSQSTFDERYTTTLGINISKKIVELRNPRPVGAKRVEMILFDVMGQRTLRNLLVESYFRGAQALIAVWDVTRPRTLHELEGWIELADEVAGRIPVVIASNKVDLLTGPPSGSTEVEDLARAYEARSFPTSAKTGENVEAAFEHLAGELLRRAVSSPASGPTGPS